MRWRTLAMKLFRPNFVSLCLHMAVGALLPPGVRMERNESIAHASATYTHLGCKLARHT